MAETDLWFGALSATVRVEDLPASRQVVAIERQTSGSWRVCGQAVSNPDGIATLPITGRPTSRIYAVAIDEWGTSFTPGMSVAYGDVIRPTPFLGWMYQVTSPGVLPSTEPDWWNSMAGVPQPVGTAMMQAVRHYQPIAHGPVSDVIWVEGEFDPYWDQVVALLRFDGDLINDKTKALPWKYVGGANFGQGLFAAALDCSTINTALAIQTAPIAFDTQLNMTLEGFFKSSGNSRQTLFQLDNWVAEQGAVTIFTINNTLVIRCARNTAGSPFTDITAPFVFPAGWLHIAVCFEAGRVRIYIDGKVIINGPLDPSKFFLGISRIAVCGDHGGTDGNFIADRYFKGLVDELRISNGVARYAVDFDPPAAPLPNVGPPI